MLDVDTLPPSGDTWILVPNWSRFQHYRDRNPLWIKVYAKLLHDPHYLGLSLAAKGLLQVVWLAYSQTNGVLSVTDLGRLTGRRGGFGLQLVSLNHAGFIDFSASKPLAAKTEGETEIETPSPLPDEHAEAELLKCAWDLALDWNGRAQEPFNDAVEALERRLHVHLGESMRSRLWDEARKRRNPT